MIPWVALAGLVLFALVGLLPLLFGRCQDE
jgi:hypothetical protein